MTTPETLATTVWGGGGRRALLLHGLSSAGANWWRVGAALAEAGFTAVAPDLRAHGASPRGDNLTIESYRDDVLLLGGDWDMLIGHSLGGAIAAAVMAEQPLFAKRVVLEDPAVNSAGTARFLADRPEPLSHPTIELVAAEHPDWHSHDVELKVRALLQCGIEGPVRTMEDASPWDVWSDILALRVPTLLLAADPELGALVSADMGSVAMRENNLIEFQVVAGGSHSMHRDSYHQYMAIVRKFVVG